MVQQIKGIFLKAWEGWGGGVCVTKSGNQMLLVRGETVSVGVSAEDQRAMAVMQEEREEWPQTRHRMGSFGSLDLRTRALARPTQRGCVCRRVGERIQTFLLPSSITSRFAFSQAQKCLRRLANKP